MGLELVASLHAHTGNYKLINALVTPVMILVPKLLTGFAKHCSSLWLTGMEACHQVNLVERKKCMNVVLFKMAKPFRESLDEIGV